MAPQVTLERSTGSASAAFDTGLNFSDGLQPDQTLGGTGEVVLRLTGTNSIAQRFVRVRSTVGSLTIGENVTVRSADDSQYVTLGGVQPLIIEGTVSSQSTASSLNTLLVTGSTVTNEGTLQSLAGELHVNNLTLNLGQTLIDGGDFVVNGTYSVDQPVSINGGLDLDGSYTIDQPVSLLSGSLTFSGDWDNESTIDQSGGTIHLGDTFTVADLGTFTGDTGTVNIFGDLDDPGQTLTIDARTWQLDGGQIIGLTLADGGAGGSFQVTSNDGTLDGVTLAVDSTLQQGAQVTVLKDLILDNATLTLQRLTTSSNVEFDTGLNFSDVDQPNQTLGGSGEVVLQQSGNGNVASRLLRVHSTVGSLTIGENVTVRSTSDSRFVTLGGVFPLIIEGTVSSRATSSPPTLLVTGSTVTNNGTLESRTGTLDVDNLIGNLGQTSINGGDLLVSGSFSVDQPVTINGGLDLDGSYTIDQPVSLLSGRLTLSGDWDNESTIDQSAGTINLGGVFTVDDLGATVPTNFTGSGGTVNIIGTLSAGVNSVLLINSERTWQLNGGTIQDVTIDDDNNGGAPATLQVTSNDGALDGVILGVDTTMVTGAVVTVTNDLILDDVTLRLSRAGNINTPDDIDLRFSGGSQTLGGVGVVELLNSFGVNALERYLRVRPADGADLLIDSGITVQNDPSSVFYDVGGGIPACRSRLPEL